jgi:hypothetical protein
MNQSRLKNLPFDPSKPLMDNVRRELIKIVENEFAAQATIFHSKAEEARERFLVKYRKENRFEALRRKADSLQRKRDRMMETFRQKEREREAAIDAEIATAWEEVFRLGIDENGLVSDRYGMKKEHREKMQSLRQRLAAIGEAVIPATNLKNKVIGRLLIATTTGEAMFILKEVLGNGVLPDIEVNQLKALPSPEKQ